jgi:uncharacterized protein
MVNLGVTQPMSKTISSSTLKKISPDGQCDCACQITQSSLAAWIHLSDSCNLGCDYCYLSHLPSHLSLETGRAIIDSLIRSAKIHHYPAIKLKYAGGEPLLRLPELLELHAYAQQQTADQHLELDAIVLSNGILLSQDYASQLRAAGLRLMISMDGLGEFHDQQRHYSNGRGSISQVISGIENALTNQLTPEISITVTSRNISGLPILLEWVLAQALPFSLNFYRKNPLSANQTDLDLEDRTFIEGMKAAYQIIENHLPTQNLSASLLDRVNLGFAHDHPCAAGHDYLAFNTQGQVSLCQMQMDTHFTDCWSVDPLGDVRAVAHQQNPPVDEKTGCTDCPWSRYCAGGCPAQARLESGSSAMRTSNCAIYQALIPEVLRLEALQNTQMAFPILPLRQILAEQKVE